jgi:MFS family permease
VLSVFYISYIVFEIPSNIACKWLGPGWFLPAISLGFGCMTVAFAFVRTFSTACAVRFLLGICEAGMLPGIAYYMSRWYRRSELTFRLSLYIVMAPLAGAFGGLLSSAILTLPNVGSTQRWEMIFAVEGIVTIGLALVSFFTLTDRPETATWLTPEEKELAAARIRTERVGTSEVLDKLNTRKTLQGIFNPVTLATSWIALLDNVTVQGIAFFAPTVVRTIYPQASTVSQQLYTVPPYVVGAVSVLATSFASWKMDKRNLFLAALAPLMMTGYVMFLATETWQSQVRYAATFLIASGAFPYAALCNAQVSANVISDSARSSAIGTYVVSALPSSTDMINHVYINADVLRCAD